MADRNTPEKGAKPAPTRDDRLKVALKANLARRKAQAKARGGETAGKPGRKEGS